MIVVTQRYFGLLAQKHDISCELWAPFGEIPEDSEGDANCPMVWNILKVVFPVWIQTHGFSAAPVSQISRPQDKLELITSATLLARKSAIPVLNIEHFQEPLVSSSWTHSFLGPSYQGNSYQGKFSGRDLKRWCFQTFDQKLSPVNNIKLPGTMW